MPTIGSSDLDVYPLALGGNTFGWTSDEATSVEVLDAYIAAGGNFVDTADGYSAWAPGNSGGESETIIGRWMSRRGNRDSVVIGTKVSQHPDFRGLSASTVAAAANASLQRLGTDHIDLYYAHFDDAATPLEETVAAFNDLVVAGKVRHVAVSNYSAERIDEWVSIARTNGFVLPVALQPHYNLVHREQFERDLAPAAERFNLGVMPYYALASGFLTGKYRTREDLAGAARGQAAGGYLTDGGLAVVLTLAEIGSVHNAEIATVALAWLQSKPTVVAPVASASVVAQLGALMAAAELSLSADEIAALDAVSAAVGETTPA
ncbi:aryl-alcohol dehydrogenase (NADP+) [Glaciihabitans tibetensis]|uniref:Aryl-alcohol dehydrogenase (NADP+) n=1 Tax=Glaciihabitans tibetensis TaxID=1266600 RepID=A0A2T0VFP9_9MICO|nr:aldo/keto reductase [Glaciihabitans tibetensis]PRY68996.1 aryl-alcohol dehydrogenase (NADP+) [Glaciihabitans tibetensis]